MSRREALGAIGATGIVVATGCSDASERPSGSGTSPDGDSAGIGLDSLSCVVTPALDEGPFFVDERLERSDLVAGESASGITRGSPLVLELGVFGVSGRQCTPLTNALVDIWHADVDGLYSDVAPSFVQPTDTTGETFLRGYQVVNSEGLVTFQTIYPGWYATRTIHVHAKIRRFSADGGAALEATTQVFFDDAITDAVFAGSAYLERGPRSIPQNTSDEIYNGTGPGRALDSVGPAPGQARPGELALAELRPTLIAGKPGYLARFRIGVLLG